MCTFMALETIERYNNSGSEVHVVLLDASKAFDRVDYIKLFNKQLDRAMRPLSQIVIDYVYKTKNVSKME